VGRCVSYVNVLVRVCRNVDIPRKKWLFRRLSEWECKESFVRIPSKARQWSDLDLDSKVERWRDAILSHRDIEPSWVLSVPLPREYYERPERRDWEKQWPLSR